MMKLPRFTIRRLMILVALVALLMGPLILLIQLDRAFKKAYGPGGKFIGHQKP